MNLFDALFFALLVLTFLLHLLQFALIPWLTRRKIKAFFEDIDEEMVIKFVRIVARHFVKHIRDGTFIKEVQKRLLQSAQQMVKGQKSGDARRLKVGQAALFKDIMSNTDIGKFLLAFPGVHNWVKEEPANAETFVMYILPKLEAMRARAKQLQSETAPPSGIDAAVSLLSQGGLTQKPLNSDEVNIPPPGENHGNSV